MRRVTRLSTIIIVIAVISLGSIVFTGKACIDRDDKMWAHVHELYPDLTDIRTRCANFDTDGDGYIRCTATGVGRDGSRQTIEAECSWLGGCVPIRARLP